MFYEYWLFEMKPLAAFLVISLIIGAVLQGTHYDSKYLVVAFATALIVLSLVFRCVATLPGDAVDVVYYIGAIVAATLLFISRDGDRQVLQASDEVAKLRNEQRSLTATTKATKNDILDRRAQLSSAQATIKSLETFLHSPDAESLISNEEDISIALLQSFPFTEFSSRLQSQHDQCQQMVPALEAENQFIFSKRFKVQIAPPRLGQSGVFADPSDKIDEMWDQARLDVNTRTLADCSQIAEANSRTSHLSPSFEKVMVLQTYMLTSLLKSDSSLATLSGSIRIGDRDEPISGTVDKIVLLQTGRLRLSTLVKNSELLEKEIATGLHDIARAKVRRFVVHHKIVGAKSEIRRMKDAIVGGWSLLAGKWLLLVWPYLLITLVGLKMAVKKKRSA